MNANEVIINGEVYVKKGDYDFAVTDGLEYCMVRNTSAGVFAGYVESRNGKEVVLRNARRIWKWAGAASLSQLAMEGTSKPNECKFPIAVGRVVLTDAIEIINITERAKKSIEEVPVWSE